jgi:hypothetical protein
MPRGWRCACVAVVAGDRRARADPQATDVVTGARGAIVARLAAALGHELALAVPRVALVRGADRVDLGIAHDDGGRIQGAKALARLGLVAIQRALAQVGALATVGVARALTAAGPGLALARAADIAGGAGLAVLARQAVCGLEHASGRRVATVLGTCVAIVARDRLAAARPGLARIAGGACAAVVARLVLGILSAQAAFARIRGAGIAVVAQVAGVVGRAVAVVVQAVAGLGGGDRRTARGQAGGSAPALAHATRDQRAVRE